MSLTSCINKDLCFDHDGHVPQRTVNLAATYRLEWEQTYEGTDWRNHWPAEMPMTYDDLRPAIPAGLRILDYTPYGGVNTLNHEPHGGTVNFSEGTHSLLCYNNDTQYIVFDQLASYAEARATTRLRTRSTYGGSPYSSRGTEETTVNAPDMLFGCYITDFTSEASTETQHLPLDMRPLVFTYLVRCEFAHGLEYVSLARGALAGMAQSVYLNSGSTTTDVATVLFDCEVEPSFGVTATVKSFGIPDFPRSAYSRSGNSYGLNLELCLRNGKLLSYDFDVSEQVSAQPQGGIIRVSGLAVADEDGQSGSSAFDVSVDGWGVHQDIDLPI